MPHDPEGSHSPLSPEAQRINILKRRIEMAVKKVGEKYRCNVCGNEVTVTKVGGGTLVCCGQDMELISS